MGDFDFVCPAGEEVRELLGALTLLRGNELTKEECLKRVGNLSVALVRDLFITPKVATNVLKCIKNIPKAKKAAQGICKLFKKCRATKQAANRVIGKGSARCTARAATVSNKMIGSGSMLRRVKFFKGLQHAKEKHFFGKGIYSLRNLDPKGNPDIWLKKIIQLAQIEKGEIKNVATGQVMEIMGQISKSDNSGILNIGVRLFKASGSHEWKLITILTKQ